MKAGGWLMIFVLDAICELLSIHYNWKEVGYFSKPLITILLAIYSLWFLKASPTLRSLLLTGLGFSLCGDIFLLFDESRPTFFILGLCSFLLAHFFYILLFLRARRKGQYTRKHLGWPVITIIIYTITLFLFILPGLGPLQIPVLIYACILSAMLIACISSFGFSKKAGNTCIAGAILFVLSDSLLAINKFRYTLPQAGLLIMLSYILAQFFIVTGFCRYIGAQITGQSKKAETVTNRNI